MQVCKTQTIKLSFVRIVSLSAMDISSADNACGMQAFQGGRKLFLTVAAIFDQLFQIIEEDWGHSLQLPAALVKYHTSR